MGLALCGLTFVMTALLTWRSVAAGLGAVVTVGYGYGILRANFPDTFSHFIFDMSVLGFFVVYFGTGGLKTILDPHQQSLQRWTSFLIGWPVLMFLLPIQDPLIQLVGLRGNVYLLPFLLVGGRLTRDDANGLALWLAVLNHVAFGFAVAEYSLGLLTFYPNNTVTEIIYKSRDVVDAGYAAWRIPATFSNAHSYGGTMAITLPWLLGTWNQQRTVDWQRMVLLSGMAVAIFGIFLCAGRTPMILLSLVVVVATFSGHMRGTIWVFWALLIVGVIYVVSGEDRMQRFTTLQDTDYVTERIHGSVNMTFLDLLVEFPFGNGLGAGGTSIPFFLQHRLRNPIIMENEYGRILLEQGVAGLALWTTFIIWFLGRRPADPRDSWQFGKTLIWVFTLASFAIAVTGLGLMISVPTSMMLFVGIGFASAPPALVKRPRPKPAPSTTDPALAVSAITPGAP
jgi:hypothetical protein